MGDDDRLARIENKIDNLIDQLHNLEKTDTRQEMRIGQLEARGDSHSQALARYFERLEKVENKPAQAALQMWGKIGSIALSVIVTAIATFILVYMGVKK